MISQRCTPWSAFFLPSHTLVVRPVSWKEGLWDFPCGFWPMA